MNFHFSNIKVYFWSPLSRFYPEKSLFPTTEALSAYLHIELAPQRDPSTQDIMVTRLQRQY